jgi:DNA-binding GntR family transcriptional regulator
MKYTLFFIKDHVNWVESRMLQNIMPPINVDESDASNLHLLPRSLLNRNLPDHVRSVLFEAILTGVLAPGERLMVDEVAEHFGVSKIPVREALKALESEGWVEIRPRRGTFVKPLSETELRQVFEMRRVLEPYSARLAALRRSDAQLVELEGLVAEGIQAIHAGDVARTTRANSQFHSVMAEAMNNELMGAAISNLESRLRRYFMAVEWQQRAESMAQHRAIFEAIRDKNAALAEKLTVAHIGHTEALAFRSVHPEAEVEPAPGGARRLS